MPQKNSSSDFVTSTQSGTQYPPPTGRYKVVFQSGDKCQAFNHARLHISLGYEKTEAAKLAAILEWMGHRFTQDKESTITLCLNDTLYAHALKDKFSYQTGLTHSHETGTEWLLRNREIIATALPKGSGEFRLRRWDSIKSLPTFKEKQKFVNTLYGQDPTYRATILKEAEGVFERRMKAGKYSETDKDKCLPLVRDFILEEHAGFAAMHTSMPRPALNIYPGTLIMKNLRAAVPPDYKEALQMGGFMKYDLKRNHGYAPSPTPFEPNDNPFEND